MTKPTRAAGASRLAATALCLSVFAFPGASHAEDRSQPPAHARAMTAYEVVVLYRGKSWQWPDGAGRMEAEGRRFTAITGSDDDASWAEGRWLVTNSGRMCLDADWHSSAGIFPDRTCFAHRIDGETIYQRRSPAGDWYVFKHAPAEADDEFARLVAKDLVSAGLEEVRSAIRPQQPSSAPSISGVNDNE